MNKRRIQPDIQEGGWEVWEWGIVRNRFSLIFYFIIGYIRY